MKSMYNEEQNRKALELLAKHKKEAKRIRKIIEIVYYITVYFIFCLIIGLVLRVWGIFF